MNDDKQTTAPEDEQTRERRERAEQDARRKAGASEYDADQARARMRLEADAHVEPEPLVGTWPTPGTWWLLPPWLKEPRRVTGVDAANDCVDHASVGTPTNHSRHFGPWLSWKPASPREVLDAKLATLTPEQRARVTIRKLSNYNARCVQVDGVDVRSCFAYGLWWGNDNPNRSNDVDAGIDSMLAALDAALSAPAPQLTRTEAIKARYANEPRVTIEDRGSWSTVAIVAGEEIYYWSPTGDDNSENMLTDEPAGMIDAALAKATPAQADDGHACNQWKECGDECVTPARAMEAATTVFDTASKPLGYELASARDVCNERDKLRAQLATATADRDRLRREASLALDATTQLRRVHAELGRLIETMDVLLKDGGA